MLPVPESSPAEQQARVSLTLPVPETLSPGLATGTKSHFFSRSSAGTSMPRLMLSPELQSVPLPRLPAALPEQVLPEPEPVPELSALTELQAPSESAFWEPAVPVLHIHY